MRGISPRDMTPWNACPWYTAGSRPTAAELEAGVEPWIQLLGLLPSLQVIMLLAGDAQKAGDGCTGRIRAWHHSTI
jgi:hypothetical protein